MEHAQRRDDHYFELNKRPAAANYHEAANFEKARGESIRIRFAEAQYQLMMSSALEVFDIIQTIGITTCLVITIPLACFVYFKLLFVRPFSENYTFKLIVINGLTELMNCLIYLINYQLVTYPFMVGFYTSVQEADLVMPLTIVWAILASFSLHTSLFIALNRMKTIVYIRKKSNDFLFFIVSIAISVVLAIPSVLDYCITTTVVLVPFIFNNELIMIPNNIVSNEILRTISDIVRFVVSFATLIVNIILCVLITRERHFLHFSERQRFNGEKGLVITSIISYTFYMLYLINNVIARYFDNMVCGYVQWLFLGLNAITPFWCLLMFTPSVRRLALKRKRSATATTILRQTVTILNNPIGS